MYVGQHTYLSVKGGHVVTCVSAASATGEIRRAVLDIGHLVRRVVLSGIRVPIRV